MSNYKITFNLAAPISFIDRPVLDSMLAWCYMKDKYGYVEQKLSLSENDIKDFRDLIPLEHHPDGWFYASWMFWNEEEHAEFTGSWKKRWANEHDHLADFGKKVKKVRISGSEYKSYDVPLVLHDLRKVWFYFRSDKPEEVERLLGHLYGIGKKTSQGYGEIESFRIEQVEADPFASVIRPIPVKEESLQVDSLAVRYMGYRPPYWLPENQGFCIAPELGMPEID